MNPARTLQPSSSLTKVRASQMLQIPKSYQRIVFTNTLVSPVEGSSKGAKMNIPPPPPPQNLQKEANTSC
ncbi:hypothetical protein TWF481_011624 [Arthrobotrys musiformis]|uniref:Uncharacterized protein n=1 Tax=Arthrobotrys musiformis TaxID=47236 RepID=A0AAV9W1B9_9PEZI